eukprot:CAMPEP_0197845570 /NCGR_PEP_ID=MMETSP1438-20131217/2486_1 /TAXON_ID=1461541 /ORGANISM="Pterosperma sp., Strain CCMP1384" /LENGTH=1053 /DNA_ID=CAMNT_0043456915 /DNA_START=264 /DNA_END=3422 /DNA_ORIENTATION=+
MRSYDCALKNALLILGLTSDFMLQNALAGPDGSGCVHGFTEKKGDIIGFGKMTYKGREYGGGAQVPHYMRNKCVGCAYWCDMIPDCGAYECEPKTSKCNLNSKDELKDHQGTAFGDWDHCQKNPDMLNDAQNNPKLALTDEWFIDDRANGWSLHYTEKQADQRASLLSDGSVETIAYIRPSDYSSYGGHNKLNYWAAELEKPAFVSTVVIKRRAWMSNWIGLQVRVTTGPDHSDLIDVMPCFTVPEEGHADDYILEAPCGMYGRYVWISLPYEVEGEDVEENLKQFSASGGPMWSASIKAMQRRRNEYDEVVGDDKWQGIALTEVEVYGDVNIDANDARLYAACPAPDTRPDTGQHPNMEKGKFFNELTLTQDAWQTYAGWFDISGTGCCMDFCRWVGGDPGGSKRNPADGMVHGDIYWSCRMNVGQINGRTNGYFPWSEQVYETVPAEWTGIEQKTHFPNGWYYSRCEAKGALDKYGYSRSPGGCVVEAIGQWRQKRSFIGVEPDGSNTYELTTKITQVSGTSMTDSTKTSLKERIETGVSVTVGYTPPGETGGMHVSGTASFAYESTTEETTEITNSVTSSLSQSTSITDKVTIPGSNALWIWEYSVNKNCQDNSENMLLRLPTLAYAITPSKSEPPCCREGMFEDKFNPHTSFCKQVRTPQGTWIDTVDFCPTRTAAPTPSPTATPTAAPTPAPTYPAGSCAVPTALLWLSGEENLSEGKTATQSATSHNATALRAVDGNDSGDWAHHSCVHSPSTTDPWWKVDLETSSNITKVAIMQRWGFGSRIAGALILISNTDDLANATTCAGPLPSFDGKREFDCVGDARYVWVQIPGSEKVLNFCEVEVYGGAAGGRNCPPAEDGTGYDCLNSNTGYDTLEAAWAACGTVSGCGSILSVPSGQYYLRRATDPLGAEGQRLAFNCATTTICGTSAQLAACIEWGRYSKQDNACQVYANGFTAGSYTCAHCGSLDRDYLSCDFDECVAFCIDMYDSTEALRVDVQAHVNCQQGCQYMADLKIATPAPTAAPTTPAPTYPAGSCAVPTALLWLSGEE